jgi:hypothetical protein
MQPTRSLGSWFSMRLSAMAGCHSGSALKSRMRDHTVSAAASITDET